MSRLLCRFFYTSAPNTSFRSCWDITDFFLANFLHEPTVKSVRICKAIGSWTFSKSVYVHSQGFKRKPWTYSIPKSNVNWVLNDEQLCSYTLYSTTQLDVSRLYRLKMLQVRSLMGIEHIQIYMKCGYCCEQSSYWIGRNCSDLRGLKAVVIAKCEVVYMTSVTAVRCIIRMGFPSWGLKAQSSYR